MREKSLEVEKIRLACPKLKRSSTLNFMEKNFKVIFPMKQDNSDLYIRSMHYERYWAELVYCGKWISFVPKHRVEWKTHVRERCYRGSIIKGNIFRWRASALLLPLNGYRAIFCSNGLSRLRFLITGWAEAMSELNTQSSLCWRIRNIEGTHKK